LAHSVHMFTQALKKRVLGSNLVNLLTRPHGVDRYAELLAPTWKLSEAPVKGGVRWTTADGASVVLAPHDEFGNTVKAGQCVNLTVGIAAGKSLRFTRQCQGRFEPRASHRTSRRRVGIDISM
jgi:stearoyl-CoA 9-desaturase NADPH oxidoreductase